MSTTRPVFSGTRKPFTTSRLLIRPITVEDVEEFHILRTQPEVMINTTSGKVDDDRDSTRAWVDRFVSPNDATTFSFAIEELAKPGNILGTIGSHLAEPPTLGYMFRKEFWGRGYATEALKAFLIEYWKLPRRLVDLESVMPENSISSSGDGARELLIAEIEKSNIGSQKVLERCGFQPSGKKEDVEDWRGKAVIVQYYLERPKS